MGAFAVQIAKASGATVTAVCSTSKADSRGNGQALTVRQAAVLLPDQKISEPPGYAGDWRPRGAIRAPG